MAEVLYAAATISRLFRLVGWAQSAAQERQYFKAMANAGYTKEEAKAAQGAWQYLTMSDKDKAKTKNNLKKRWTKEDPNTTDEDVERAIAAMLVRLFLVLENPELAHALLHNKKLEEAASQIVRGWRKALEDTDSAANDVPEVVRIARSLAEYVSPFYARETETEQSARHAKAAERLRSLGLGDKATDQIILAATWLTSSREGRAKIEAEHEPTRETKGWLANVACITMGGADIRHAWFDDPRVEEDVRRILEQKPPQPTPAPVSGPAQAKADGEPKKCPYCAEALGADAAMCWRCGKLLPR